MTFTRGGSSARPPLARNAPRQRAQTASNRSRAWVGLKTARSFSHGIPFVLQLRFCHDFIVLKFQIPSAFLDPNAHQLFPRFGRTRVADDIIPKHQAPGFATHTDPRGLVLSPIILNHVLFHPIPVTRHRLGLVAEINAVFGIAADLIFLKNIIGILMADRDAVSAIVFQKVLFEKAMPDAPAQEQAVLAVVARDATTHDGSLRTAARMHPQPGIALAGAVFDQDIVGLLKADAITVVVLDHAIVNNRAKSAIKEDPPATAPVQRHILVLVSINDQILKPGSLEVITAHN